MHSHAAELGGRLRSRVAAGLEKHVPRLAAGLERQAPRLAAELERRVPALAHRVSPSRRGLRHSHEEPEDEDGGQGEADSAAAAAEPAAIPTLVLHVRLLHGRHLVAMDSCGTSDPYVKFKLGSKTVYKSSISYKTLNPVWNETFQVVLQRQFKNLNLKVYDHDWGLNDDFLGQAKIDLSSLPLDQEQELTVALADPDEATVTFTSRHQVAVTSPGQGVVTSLDARDVTGPLGTVSLALRLVPLSDDEVEQLEGSSRCRDEGRQRQQAWSHVVHVVLVEGRDLLSMDVGHTSDPYVKLRLGKEKFKSHTVGHSLSPYWGEECCFHLYPDGCQRLEVEVFDRDQMTVDDFMGSGSLDLSLLSPERSHSVWVPLEEGAGAVRLVITISGTTHVETASDLLCHQHDPPHTEQQIRQLSFPRTLERLTPVGHLSVKVLRARGLAAADLNGRSDPFCVLQLVNRRRQTQTVYKTLEPYWNKVFSLEVNDIHSVLEVTVYDQDKDHAVDFLGKLAIPLLQIQSGKRRWYLLKDERLRHRAKGKNPQILLEFDLIWNQVRAALRTFTPREQPLVRPPVRFRMSAFVRILNRLNALSVGALELHAFISRVLAWESAPRSVSVWIGFLCVTYCFQLYMVPALLLLAVFGRWMMRMASSFRGQSQAELEGGDPPLEEEDDALEDEDLSSSRESLEVDLRYWRYLPDEKKTLKEKVLSVQEVTSLVQTSLGYLASLTERILNTADFVVPFVSWLAVLLLLGTTALCYLLPVRYIVMLMGSYKFTKGLLFPGTVSTHELINFLACVPDSEQLKQWRELGPPPVTAADRRRRQRARHRLGRRH
ncbi:multiple C2 and transmembrane domain-containing protein-like isoform X2 [Amphibalanus amphitrite]|uniref:multiple C2 and transmembrane domain-containing protein-like isoform X2 n=1 Tax=Amphibalanus amphitrite TaxID=1232801 RepID=UPI001C91F954|nr:multiple C2 and transmembrane domain-containing protein-like isoform X2 [Amphibalanus amphitrite]